MSETEPLTINIAIVGGGAFCKEVLEKTILDYKEKAVGRIMAVVDKDPDTPGMVLARELGLKTLADYHELYDPEHDIHAFILLTPQQSILDDILNTKPYTIRVISYPVFELFWKAIGMEERKLRERTQEMETILNGIQDFILVITPGREILEVNEAFLKKMGFSREEVIGRKCHEVYQNVQSPCSLGAAHCPLNKVIRNKRPSQQIRTRVDHSGDLRWIEVTIFPIWEKGGKISRFIEISRDITARKREEEEMTRRLERMVEQRTKQLRETHAKLLHQDKMASLGKLSASVVHEINNPIAGILNLSMLMRRILGEGPVAEKDMGEFDEYLALMETETRRISRIVSNLLSFSRQSKVEPKKIDLKRLIERTLFLNSNLLKIGGVKVEKKMDPDAPEIVGSEDQLQQVFMNLVSNAAEAMESKGGGVLTIETSHIPREGKIVIRFKDKGVGIPQEDFSKLFEPFFTTKKKGKGVGLGLSVVYGILEEHGGAIRVDSEEGEGTTFSVFLPVEQPAASSGRDGGPHGRH